MQQQFKRAAIAVTVTSASLAQAVEQEPIEPEVIVSASRFAESARGIASNVSVVTANDIRNSPATNLPDLLKGSAGIEVRPLYGNMGIDAAVDLRGFGDTAASNTLVLLDGQRMNPIDGGGISWSAIPLNSIERIEIVRGAGTVLYGDRASGGVINIITKKTATAGASVAATFGSYGYRGVDANLSGRAQETYFNIAGHYADTDGWRDNSQANQKAISGRTGTFLSGDNGEVFFDFAGYKDKSGLPGSLLSPAFNNDPSSARTPFDTQERDGYRLRPGVSLALSDTIQLEAEISDNHEKYHADNVSFGSLFDRTSDTVSITPRLRWRHGLGALASETVMGADYYNGKVSSQSSTYAAQQAKQISEALYVQNTTNLDEHWATTIGARRQRMNQRASQDAYALYGYPAFADSSVRFRNAYDLGLAYRAVAWRAYARYGSIFRFANTDELFGFDPFTGNPVFAGDLKPQHGRSGEIGVNFEQGDWRGRASVYQIRLTDEIGFDGAAFANVNLDPTRRSGMETELNWRLSKSIDTGVTYTYTDAKFREGMYAGNDIPLVARDKASTHLTWEGGEIGTYTVVGNYIGERVFSGDFANIRGKLSAYTTFDLQARWDRQAWTFTAKLLNAFDKRYATTGGYSSFYADHYYFPGEPRSVFVSANYSFR